MHSYLLLLGAVLLSLPVQSYGIDCWCQQGPSSYQSLVNNEQSYSLYTNCYLSGNNPSTDTCYDAICPGGEWVKSNYYAYNEIYVSASSGDDCISQCSAMGNGYNIANTWASSCTDASTTGSCNVMSCPNVWDGHCGVFNKPTDKWCDYDGTDANVCCSADFSDCCESDGGSVAVAIVIPIVFVGICIWLCKRRRGRDNTNEDPPNCCFKFWCPHFAVFSYQGCENGLDACMVCFLGTWFTMCCWQPKKVCVGESNPKLSEIPVAHAAVPITEQPGEKL
jgi:hypothetical protein